jgi:hypothetical protein
MTMEIEKIEEPEKSLGDTTARAWLLINMGHKGDAEGLSSGSHTWITK